MQPTFGPALKTWREGRRLTQLALSGEVGISQRHLSFLETGRARPSRATVLALARQLDVPLRERNEWLVRAGFAPEYPGTTIDEAAMGPFRTALQSVLDHHEPYPAFVIDRRWNPVMANNASMRFFARFVDPTGLLNPDGDFLIIRACMAEDRLKPYLENWSELMGALLDRCQRALLIDPMNEGLKRIVADILDLPDAPPQPDHRGLQPVVPLIFRDGDERFAFFTMLAGFGAAQDVTLDELKVELMFPADDTTRRAMAQG